MEPRAASDGAIILAGASVRAAAQSALAAGWQPYAADLFADSDLAAICPAERVTDYPQGLVAAVERFPPGPWLYTGALENHPQVIEAISRTRPLWGNAADVVRGVRDPVRWTEALRQAGQRSPRVALPAEGLPTDGSWLRKPLRSAGGFRIGPWTGLADAQETGWYYQERIAGESCSAVYVAAQGEARLLGVTQQLTGLEWLHARPFHYCGSVGPIVLNAAERQRWTSIGEALAAAFRLTGLFGVDAIVARSGEDAEIWPVEINPRYTASMEVVERLAGRSLLGVHGAACRDGRLLTEFPLDTSRVVAKGIYYARHDILFTEAAWVAAAQEGPDGGCADIPQLGSLIAAGDPVLTLFATAGSAQAAGYDLQRQAQAWDARLAPPA